MNARILLTDDEREFAEVLAERLKSRGFHVRIALSGEEALSKLEEEPADIVILDVRMPGKDGIQTLREIKSLSPRTEVIFLTGHAAIETAVAGVRNGAYAYLTKPAELSELLEKIEEARINQAKQDQQETHTANGAG